MSNIISDIVTGAEHLIQEGEVAWSKVEAAIEGQVATVQKALPAASAQITQLETDVKQGASDALGAGATILGAAQPLIVTGVNTAANAGLLALTGGAATPALPGVDGWIDGLVEAGIAALQAWALNQKAINATPAPAVPAATPVGTAAA